jgi:uncharacterized membrane protein
VSATAALIVWQLLWETVLAPIRPGGSWLALKALPLALAWPALARATATGRVATALLLLIAAAEAIVRALTESGRHALAAWVALALAAVAFIALLRPRI